MTQNLNLRQVSHPNSQSKQDFENLFGIDQIKRDLLLSLQFMLDTGKVDRWISKYRVKSDAYLCSVISNQRLVILSGDVGCGKTMLANSVASPLAELIDSKVLCLESPTNVRGQGMVGELSARITSLFDQAKSKVSGGRAGLLIIDEADDIATSRTQIQAHHEDRAGVNVLARQIDSISNENVSLGVILITNRISILDPAIVRRSASIFTFDRPSYESRKMIFSHLSKKFDLALTDKEISNLSKYTEQDSVAFTYSDILNRGIKSVLLRAINEDRPLDYTILSEVFEEIQPTPKL